MKTEKEVLCEFVGLVFGIEQSDFKDVFSKINLMECSLSSVRLAANDAIEISSSLPISEQESLNDKMLSLGLPSLHTIQNKAFKDFLKIANRGSIRNEMEYYLVRSLSETSVLNQEYQGIAYGLLEGYE